MHPANLALRFILEVSALSGYGILAWRSANGGWRVVVLVLVLCIVMTFWGVFAVPNDPSRSGSAPIPVSGLVRLGLELVILLGGALSFYWAGYNLAAISLAIFVLLHYALSSARIVWLLQK